MRKSKTPSLKGFKQLQCKYCDHVCDRIDMNATAVTCFKCISKLVNGQHLEIRK